MTLGAAASGATIDLAGGNDTLTLANATNSLSVGNVEGTHANTVLDVPGLLSWLATGSTDGTVQGIDNLQQQYVQQYFEEIRKAPGAATRGKAEPKRDSRPARPPAPRPREGRRRRGRRPSPRPRPSR